MGSAFISDTYVNEYYQAAAKQKKKTDLKTRSQIWLSQPREADSKVVEVLTYNFASRAPISSISFDIYSVGAHYEFWYWDSDGTRLPLIRNDYNQIMFEVESKEKWDEWMHWSFDVLPCVATKLEVRMSRIHDDLAPQSVYSLGLRKLAIRRQVNARADAALPMRPSKDILGNTISKTVKDWQPAMMIDGKDWTFWKSEPQIAQDAVVCLYMDIRDKYGQPQYFDSIDIDPVYAGSQMNVYYSNDDTEGDRDVPMCAYDSVMTDMSWSSRTEDDQNLIGHYDMLTTASKMAFDLKQTDIDLSGSWIVGMSWRPVLPLKSNDQVLFSLGKNFYVKQVGKSFQFWYQDAAGMKHLDLPFPDLGSALNSQFPSGIAYLRGKRRGENRDTEIRLDFGMDRSAEEVLRIRTRFIVKNYDTGEVIADKSVQKALRTSVQLSTIVDEIPKGFVANQNSKAEDKDKTVALINSGTEVRIPPQKSWDIPLKDMSDLLDLSSAEDDYDITVTLNYRTDEDYDDGGRLAVYESDPPKNQTWWNNGENRSASHLSIDSATPYTNYFDNPKFIASGSWKPEDVSGNGTYAMTGNSLALTGKIRVRNVHKLGTEMSGTVRYVFSAVPTFSGTVNWYKDYGLYVYDGNKEEYLAFSSGAIASDKRVVLEFNAPAEARLLAFGFVGGGDGQTVTWSKPMVCTARDWESMQAKSIDYFDGSIYASSLALLPRYNKELNLNRLLDLEKPALGDISMPSSIDGVQFSKRPFAGNISLLKPFLNRYDEHAISDWIWCKGGTCLAFEFYAKSVNGFPDIQPVIIDGASVIVWPDRYQKTETSDGWWKVLARVTVPFDHDAEYMSIGLYERSTVSHTFYGDLHVYDNSDSFEDRPKYNTVRISKHISKKMTSVSLDDIVVRVSNSSKAFMYVSSCSVKADASKISSIADTTSYIGSVQGRLESFVMKQEALPKDMTNADGAYKDKFLANPDRYVSPDAYDMSSTLANSLIYGRFKDEDVLRGGIADSWYDAKEWSPLMMGRKLAKTKYIASIPVEAKYVKLEFTQLTAMQYPIEAADIKSSYRVFPTDLTAEMLKRVQADASVKNNKQTHANGYNSALTTTQQNYYKSIDLSNLSEAFQAKQDLYSNDLDTEVDNTANPIGYLPNIGADIIGAQASEYTSTALYNGQQMNSISSNETSTKLSLLARMNAQYQIYTAQASESLLALSDQYGLEDWKILLDDNGYVQDNSDKSASSGRIPGYWLFPGQQLSYSAANMKQITSTSKVDVVQKTSTSQAITTVADTRTVKPVLNVIGQKYFSYPMVHYYETRTATRTQSIAYFVAIRELSVNLIDYLQQRDNVTWSFYSLGSSPWHLNGGYMTTQNIFVPDFSTGADVAVAETDIMHSQSYYRTVKLLSVNRDSLASRTYLDFNGEPWHDSGYWDKYPWLDCKWDDSTPDDPNVYEDNGGAWNSNRFAWGDTWTGTIVPGKEWEVWYDGELVRHLVVNKEDRVFDANGAQVPFRYKLGELMVPSNSLVSLGISLFNLKKTNPSNPSKHTECRIQLVSGKYSNSYLIDEELGFDGSLLSAWQDFITSRQHLLDTTYTCQVWLYFNDFEQLDIYYKSAFIETGTMRVLMKNREDLDWEDVTSAVGRTDSQYTFKTAGRDMQIKIEMYDPQDWFGQLIVIPIYMPQEDAVDWASSAVHEVRIIYSNGSDIQLSGYAGNVFDVGVKVYWQSGLTNTYFDSLTFASSDPNVINFYRKASDPAKTEMRFLKHGTATVYAWYNGKQSKKYTIAVGY